MNRYFLFLNCLISARYARRFLPVLGLLGLFMFNGFELKAQYSITSGMLSHGEDFNTFTGELGTVPANWTWASSAPYSGFYSRGGTYNEMNATYALVDSTISPGERAFGGKFAMGGNDVNTLTFTAINNTNAAITGFQLSWIVEQYSACINASTLAFSYSINNTTFVTSNITGDLPNAPATTSSLCGNLGSIGSTIKAITINATVPVGQSIRFRFSFNNPGSDNAHVGIDDFNMTAIIPCEVPSAQAGNFSATNITSNQMTIGWTRGNGNSVLVLARAGGAVNSNPVSGQAYSANAAFGSGNQIGGGNFVVYKGAGTSVAVTNLNPSTTYHFAVYEFNDAGLCYRIPALIGNAMTLAPPPPTITHNGNAPPAANIQEGSINNILYQVQVVVANAAATLTGVEISTGGNWTATDITNFKLRFSTDSNLDTGDPVLSTVTTNLTGGTQSLSISGLSRPIPIGTSYLFITCDVKLGATIGHTVSARAAADANFTYSPASVVFSGSNFPAANLMTIVGRALIQLENAAGDPLDCNSVLNFGGVALGFDTLLTAQIHNSGSADLTISSIQLINNVPVNFVLLGTPPAILAPGDFYEMKIIFSPQASGNRTATVQIMTNALNAGTCTLNLNGSGRPSVDPVFPDLVTPNDDGHNDFFDIIFPSGTSGEAPFVLEVFNRAGGMLKTMEGFAQTGRQQIWSPEGCPDGVYYYRLTFNEKVYRGAVTIMGRQQP